MIVPINLNQLCDLHVDTMLFHEDVSPLPASEVLGLPSRELYTREVVGPRRGRIPVSLDTHLLTAWGMRKEEVFR